MGVVEGHWFALGGGTGTPGGGGRGALRLVAMALGTYRLLSGEAFGLVGLTEDVRVREDGRPEARGCVS